MPRSASEGGVNSAAGEAREAAGGSEVKAIDVAGAPPRRAVRRAIGEGCRRDKVEGGTPP
jgi:hypothetical protein